MLRESFDLINDHLERSVLGNSLSSVEISPADGTSLSSPCAYVTSGSSSSSSPVPPSTKNIESNTSSSVESSDQEEDKDITDTVSIYHHSLGYDKTLIEENRSRKSDDASSIGNDTDETAESSHDDQNVHDDEESESSHSEDDEGESGEESESEESFADDAYIQTDEVTLSVSDLERLRSLQPHGGGIQTTIPSKRTASCMEASDMVHEKEALCDINKEKRPRLTLDIEQILSAQSQQASSRRRPSASRSA